MLAALGMFIFDTDTTLFDELSRRRSWRHGRTERFGARAASQYLGPGDDQVTLSGKLIPELAGSYSSIEKLVEMADTGEAYPLADGLGNIMGSYTIETIDEQHGTLIDNGRARVIDFNIDLKRAD
jgi:phage protein U